MAKISKKVSKILQKMTEIPKKKKFRRNVEKIKY